MRKVICLCSLNLSSKLIFEGGFNTYLRALLEECTYPDKIWTVYTFMYKIKRHFRFDDELEELMIRLLTQHMDYLSKFDYKEIHKTTRQKYSVEINKVDKINGVKTVVFEIDEKTIKISIYGLQTLEHNLIYNE